MQKFFEGIEGGSERALKGYKVEASEGEFGKEAREQVDGGANPPRRRALRLGSSEQHPLCLSYPASCEELCQFISVQKMLPLA